MSRKDGRTNEQLRPVRITPDPVDFPAGSALIECGRTRVLCAASLEDRVPPFLKGTGRGWVTAEYAMLPASTPTRSQREATAGRVGGRTHEIQRLIGRSLRAVIDMKPLGERQLSIDCDVLQADGGTRTAAITGAWVALALAAERLARAEAAKAQAAAATEAAAVREQGRTTVKQAVAAVSVGIFGGEIRLDLPYEEDSRADVDCNVVMTEDGAFVEVQATAEHRAFDRRALDGMLTIAEAGIRELFLLQRAALTEGLRRRPNL